LLPLLLLLTLLPPLLLLLHRRPVEADAALEEELMDSKACILEHVGAAAVLNFTDPGVQALVMREVRGVGAAGRRRSPCVRGRLGCVQG